MGRKEGGEAVTGRERVEAVLAGKIPDRVPHFELVFQLGPEAFGLDYPTPAELERATPKEREALKERYFHMWELVIERYGWDAIQVPVDLCGYFGDQMIPEARRRFGERVCIFDFNGQGTFWMLPGNDMMEFTIKLFERREELHREARQKVRDSIALARRQIDQGVDFICINSDYGYNQGPFVSPAMFSEIVTPYLAEIVEAIHGMGGKAILHSDGDLNKILDQLVSTGLDGYQSIDPQGHMDIAAVKRQYGDRLVLMGNVQASLLQEVDEPRIRQSVRYAMEHGKPGGRYILSTSNCIFAGMPLESYHIMLDEYRRLAPYA
jgi:uroporphyrinogen decarboxylase